MKRNTSNIIEGSNVEESNEINLAINGRFDVIDAEMCEIAADLM